MRLDRESARARFAAARVARLATVSAECQPHLVPFTFAVETDRIVHAVDHKPKSSPVLRRLRNIADNCRVCALADHYSDDWDRLWWVRADGTAQVVAADSGLAALLAAKYPQYAKVPPSGPFVVIRVSRWSGWSAG